MRSEFRKPVGLLHHLELNVGDLQRTREFWGWLLDELGYEPFQDWGEGFSFRRGDTYLAFVQVEERFAQEGYHRGRIGLNHLAFHVPDHRSVDRMTEELRRRGVTILYPDRHPRAGGTSYAVFFEDPDRIKVELVADADTAWDWTARIIGQFGAVDGLAGPLTALGLFQDLPAPWGFAGGWSISLAMGRVVRPHEDVDLAILREDQQVFFRRLRDDGWDLDVAKGGGLRPLEAEEHLPMPLHTVWAVRPGRPRLELLLNEREGDNFSFRRDPQMVIPLGSAFRRTRWGLPFLSPEIVLLYKAKLHEDPKNLTDWVTTLPALTGTQRNWLAEGLRRISPEHPWLGDLA